jgi:sterol desaturase/sphingolipid hydroxylase (fatty acid hydroxylase superfamily)
MALSSLLIPIVSLLRQVGDALASNLPAMLELAACFTLVSFVATACNAAPPWWRKPGLLTDICYSLVLPIITSYGSVLLIGLGIVGLYGITDPARITSFFDDGHGPLARLGFWFQVPIYLVGLDLVLYATHRAFHHARLWRYHAIHHASEHLEWISFRRFHPVDQLFHSALGDVVMLMLGISPDVILWLAPFNVGTSALVHANLDWTFGRFGVLFASPVFHRWHHTAADRGGSSNFAATFPVIDLIFGTYYMPKGVLPDGYGVDDKAFPKGFIEQLGYPLWRNPKPDPTTTRLPAQ